MNLRLQKAGYDVITLDGEAHRRRAAMHWVIPRCSRATSTRSCCCRLVAEVIHAEVVAMLRCSSADAPRESGLRPGGKEDQALLYFFVTTSTRRPRATISDRCLYSAVSGKSPFRRSL